LKDYTEFLNRKKQITNYSGFEISDAEINQILFPFQRDIVKWALRIGKGAIFADCGLGKTFMQLEWAKHVNKYMNEKVLILAPLAVSFQTIEEGKKIGIDIQYCRKQDDIKKDIIITNYEMLSHFDVTKFSGIVLDESSILKDFSSKTCQQIIESFSQTPYKLACTATPSPNDFVELGNHAEFLNIMRYEEMLAMFFIHDGKDTSKWRLKGHAKNPFWEWLASWSIYIKNPSNLGYSDTQFNLPKIIYHEHIVETNIQNSPFLIPMEAQTLSEQRDSLRASMNDRCQKTIDIVNNSNEQWLTWCYYNKESELLAKHIDGCIEVKGADKIEHKEKAMLEFSHGSIKSLVTKPSIAGHGMNWQQCNNMIFVGLDNSFEMFYQAIRRCWRFGQKKDVNVHIVLGESDMSILRNIKRKQKQADDMAENLIKYLSDVCKQNLIQKEIVKVNNHNTKHIKTDRYELFLGDCVSEIKKIPDKSVDYIVYSPPFASLYTYSDNPEDMGNVKNDDEFFEHFKFLVPELLRVLKAGHLMSFHCMNLPVSKQTSGYIGLRDFRGELIKTFVDTNFIYHSEVCIWKDPVIAMQRTKALGLLHKQIKKDACMSRQGIPDYLVTMRKHGYNENKVAHDYESMPVSLWQQYASPIWMDIKPGNTLQKQSARANDDERHICPLQIEVIERAIHLWTNKNDVVLSPFAGIGSEGYVSLKMERRFIGIELKESYFKCMINNLNQIINDRKTELLFD